MQGVPIRCRHSLNDHNSNIYFNTEKFHISKYCEQM